MEWDSKIAEEMSVVLKGRMDAIEKHYPELVTALLKKSFRAVETNIHPKLLADWNRMGLLLAPRKKNKHHRLSMTEFVWILMLDRMRQFNLSYELIQAFRQEFVIGEEVKIGQMFSSPEGKQAITAMLGEEYKATLTAFLSDPEALALLDEMMPTVSALQGVVAISIVIGCPMSILIDKNGKALVFFQELFSMEKINKDDLQQMLHSTHFSISVTELVAKALGTAPIEKISGELRLISPQEAKVITALREEGLKSVTVRFDDRGDLDFLEMTSDQKVDKRSRLFELILSNGYQDITLKTQKGDIVHCENTRKFKLK